jgi:hypothetical protein
MDDNDILYTNQFVTRPALDNEVPDGYTDEFRRYYQKEMEQAEEKKLRENLDRVSMRSVILDEETDANNMLNTNKHHALGSEKENTGELIRKVKSVKRYVSVDSRDRNKTDYPKPNHFKIFLGKTFYNVQEIRLASIEFPNTNAVINSTNNHIYWRNQQDIDEDVVDNITKTYPVYDVELRIGSYISTSLQSEMTNKLASLKRQNKTGDFHYFTVDLDIDTDIVTMTSLILSQVKNNPFSVTLGQGIITVSADAHGYKNGDVVYIVGSKSIAGIPSSIMNAAQTITVINDDTFQFEVNVKAGETSVGGGNTVKSGKLAPFQLLYGDFSDTLAQNIGFPIENSSERIDTQIKSIQNFYQVKITLSEPHNFLNTFDYIGLTCLLNSTGTTPDLDGNRVITNIFDSRTILISVNNKLEFSVFNTGQLTFNGSTIDILGISNFDVDTVLVTTFTDHNYDTIDINNIVTFYGTTTIPSFDQSNTIYGVLSSTLLVIPGKVLDGGDINVSIPGKGGSMPRNQPLITKTVTITGLVPGNITTVTCPGHGLSVGDKIKFYNILTSPSITTTSAGIHSVYGVLDSNTFTVNFVTTSVDNEVLEKQTAYIGLSTVTVTFPYHNFNALTSIESCVDLVSPAYNVEITTQLPHNLLDGDTIRISQTNTTPSIDGGNYAIKLIDSDTFRIIFSGGIGVSTGTSGILGMSNSFHLYGATSVGGINDTAINIVSYTIKDIIDEHSFTFDCSSYASSSEKGGGMNVFISSLKHGFNGVQTNTKNSLLNRSINLEGENYAFLCCPQLATMMNTGNVENAFARITLDQSPGSMVFNYLSSPKTFDTAPLNTLDTLEFSIVNYDNTLYEFNDLDFSFTLEITELIDTTESFNFSSRRGVTS